ncbi:DUF4350 domain-containing protein [Streptomyces sp. IBSNAI002]|uniref:DUF4350 domain-containing protein n=1 Tax=Streptomyces sp. IBSNAI002 TaxID=3457500 RepID=UPI003FD42174
MTTPGSDPTPAHPGTPSSHKPDHAPGHSPQTPAHPDSDGAGHAPGRPPHASDLPGSGGAGGVSGHSREGAEHTSASLSDPSPRSAPEETPRHPPGPTGTTPSNAAPTTALAERTPPGQSNDHGTGQATAPRPDRARLIRRTRRTLAFVAVLAAGAITLAALSSGTRHGLLDPRSADPYGSRAVAELLEDRGVTTRVVTTAREAADAAGPGTTLLVTDPDRLGAHQRALLRSAMDLSGGRTVLLAPGSHSLTDLAPGVRTESATGADTLAPACDLPAAASAGPATTGDDRRYTTGLPRTTACYPSEGRPTLLVLPAGTTGNGTGTGGDTVLLGSGTILLNENLAEEGNASLALQLLGSRPDLVWYMPSLADSDSADAGTDEDKSLVELIPDGWSWALLQLFVAAALAALWRARRLGPLVTEKLPVVIRASEATEGRARLYRKAGARDRASTVLRAAARERLASLVGVPAAQAHDPVTLVPAVSARLGDGGHDVTSTLFGPTPSDDAALVALADHLDALEREVRTS